MKSVTNLRHSFFLLTFIAVVLTGNSVAEDLLYPASTVPGLPFTDVGEPDPGRFLVARRALDGTYFGQTVIYLIEHDENGTLGLVVNRPSDINLDEVLPNLNHKRAGIHVLHLGGPVKPPTMLILMQGESVPETMQPVAGEVYVGSDRDSLESILVTEIPTDKVRFFSGYSGWAAGQLNHELDRGSWHVVAADTELIFSGPADMIWDRLIGDLEPIGIQVNNRQTPLDSTGLLIRNSSSDEPGATSAI